MVQQLSTTEIIYPDSDGQPMSDNTLQFQWIVTIKENLELIHADTPDVFVAGDLLWYPVEGNNKIRQAPDALVAFGRPKGYRGSYMQWKEENIPPQVVFEVLSPGNRRTEMARKLLFYERYGVEEYYEYDPYNVELIGCLRQEGGLEPLESLDNWVSPRLNIRFSLQPETLEIYRPDGSRFLTFVELGQQLSETSQQLSEASQQLEQSQSKAERLAARLEALGIDPTSI
ncbi:MAG: Uma2 family endonuclease [Phormidesmis sp.]